MTVADQHGSDALYAHATRHLPGGNSRTTVFMAPRPPYARSGRGYMIVDEDGHRLIDLQNNYTALIHGHANPAVTAAAIAAVQDGASFGLPTRHEIALAQALSERVAVGERWRFANSGTEAVMIAIRLARAATGRQAILRFAHAYHGTYDAVLSPQSPGVAGSVAADTVVVPFDDRRAFVDAMNAHGARLAAVLLDPMPNRAGLRPVSAPFATAVQEQVARWGCLLIVDEILTFRVGIAGLHPRYGIRPDLVTLGKIVGGGFPLGVIGGREELMSHFDPRRTDRVEHGGTFSANPVAMRAGLAALRLWTPAEVDRLGALGERLRGTLTSQGWTVTGLGSLVRVHASDPVRLWWALYEAGVLLASNGLGSLSTAMDEQVIEQVQARFGELVEREPWLTQAPAARAGAGW